MAEIRVARLWSGVADGVPVLDEALARATEETPQDEILAFLGGGSEVLRASGRAEDWLTPGHPSLVPIGFRTDGDWLWSEELAYYLREHAIVPESDFLAHMSERGYAAEPASDAAVAEAERLLRAGT